MLGDNPRIVTAIVGALRFRGATPERLRLLRDSEWSELITYADLSHLTLSLALNCATYLPEWVRDKTTRNLHDNQIRAGMIQAAYRDVQSAFASANVEHIVIKGFTQCPDFAPSPRYRFQSDVDLYCPADSLEGAVKSVRQLGYESVPTPSFADHLPVMVHHRGWEWRGNPYDPEMPPSIELHHRLWNHRAMRFGPTDLEDFWSRRKFRAMNGFTYPALHPVDNLGFAAFQVLRDLLSFALAAHKVYELAYFLHHKAKDDVFWREWRLMHDQALRHSEAVSFCLAEACFGCNLAPEVAEEIAKLPRTIRAWMSEYALTSLTTYRSSEKSALWVHLALVSSTRDRVAVLKKIFPPMPKQDKALGSSARQPRKSFGPKQAAKYAAYLFARIPRHVVLVPRTIYRGVRTLAGSRHFRKHAGAMSGARDGTSYA